MQMLPPLKPPALRAGDAIRIVSLASPVDEAKLERGGQALAQLGYAPKMDRASVLAREGFFAGSTGDRVEALKRALCEPGSRAILCARGGYGSTYLLDRLRDLQAPPKIFCGFSDITSAQIFLWQRFGWVTFYGPMAASGFDGGANAPGGYDRESFVSAVAGTTQGWSMDLRGESLVPGEADGIILGGCLTLIETTLGTPWELQTDGAILVLEDRDMKPYQVDRALMHLRQAGKFDGVVAVICGEFPGGGAPPGTATVKDVVERVLATLGVPIVWGAAVGHTSRPMLTIPLGVGARVSAGARTKLEILEPAVV
jgi:muramoyltetrapeptide carboxypeptidase